MSLVKLMGISFPIVITELEKTCEACPAQWEGMTAQGERVYIRYRWGYFSFELNDREIVGGQIGDSYAGTLNDEELRTLLSTTVLLPDVIGWGGLV